MAVESRATLKTYFQTGDTPTQTQFENWHDSYWHKQDTLPTSSATGMSYTTLTADGSSMEVGYEGTTAPTLTGADGVFTLTVPAGTRLKTFDWTVASGATDGSGLQVSIVSADGRNHRGMFQLIDLGNNETVAVPSSGIIVDQAISVAGTVVVAMSAIAGFGTAGCLIMARYL